MKFWESLLVYMGIRSQVRQDGGSVSDAAKAAALALAMQEAAKKAEQEKK